MISTVEGADAVEAWQRGAELLISTPGHILRNLITEISNPTFEDNTWCDRFDPRSVGAVDRLSVVAKVLFPKAQKGANESRETYYRRWRDVLVRARAMRRLHSSWNGTYFERLLNLDNSDNQIERAIRILSEWNIRSETAFVAHLSSPTIDTPRPRGAPCLQFLEILWQDGGIIDLVALYRNHDFLNKALGNFIGLGRLLKFIAAESNKRPGRLICHSVRAYTEKVGQLQRLISQ